ncbi:MULTISPECIES: hypothetical protein [unclassified Nostoc]|nr:MULTISPECIES: hypothetical protein [unclassified Nostoc]MBE8997772.1 hypothetical protein [Nostoc sp. LEGE 12447]NEU82025.1 hypothetical protein [Nostoc sp. UIC 10630]
MSPELQALLGSGYLGDRVACLLEQGILEQTQYHLLPCIKNRQSVNM